MSFLKAIWRGNSKHKSEYKVILSSILMEMKSMSNIVKFIRGHTYTREYQDKFLNITLLTKYM